LAITLANCERIAEKDVRTQAWSIFRTNKVIKVTNVDVNEHIGSLYEGEIRDGRKKYTLCFAITKTNTIVLGKCFCGLAEGVLCPHYLAVLLYVKYKKLIEMSKNIYCPVRIVFASSSNDAISVSKTVDNVFDRYMRNGKIDDWYMPYAIEGIIFICLCAEENTTSFLERTRLYCVALEKLDKLFTASAKPISRLLLEHARGLIELISTTLKENVPKESLITVKPCYREFYNVGAKINNWVIKYNIWESIIIFCDTPSIRIDFKDKLLKKIYNQKDMKKKSDLKMLYLLLLRSYSTKKASAYLIKNLEYDSFRKLSIDLHITADQYDDAIELAKEGLDIRKSDESPKDWWEILYKIYSKLNDSENMKKYSKKLILEGDFDYFICYKKMFDEASWLKEREIILSEIKEKGMEEFYLQLILEDNLQQKLFELCNSKPTKILTLYPYFDKNYYDNLVYVLQDYRSNMKDNIDMKMIDLVIKKLSLLS